MKTIRPGLALALCAFAPLAFTGCAGDDGKSPSAETASPAPAAKNLVASLGELSGRIRMADDALARAVGDIATDPEDRLIALAKAAAALDGASAAALGGDLKKVGAAIVAGWRANANTIADAELRRVAVVSGDEAKAGFDAAEGALRDTDKALAYHAALLRDVRVALGSHPNSGQILAARPAAARAAAAGKKAQAWIAYASGLVATAGRTSVPAPVVDKPATPEPVKGEPAPEPAEAPKAEEAKPVESKPAETKPAETKPAPVEIVIEHKDAPVSAPAAPAEPQPKPATPDPIPDPAK